MAWADYTLSTTTSIAKYESGINQLCFGNSYHYSEFTGSAYLKNTTTTGSANYFEFKKYDGYIIANAPNAYYQFKCMALVDINNAIKLEYSDVHYFEPMDTIKYIYAIYQIYGMDYPQLTYYVTNDSTKMVQDGYPDPDLHFTVYGGTLHYGETESVDTYTEITNDLYTGTGSIVTWQTKIDLAKQKLADDLLIQFRSQRIMDQYNPLDLITNPEQLYAASDYLTLALIYTQIALQGLNQIYINKRNWYWKQYQKELHKVGSVVKLSNCRTTNYIGQLTI